MKQDLRRLLPAILAVVFSLALATLADDAATCQDTVACADVDTGRYPTWEDAPTSADEFDHDNPEEICRLPIISLKKWEAGKFWCVSGRDDIHTACTTRREKSTHKLHVTLLSRKAIRPAVSGHKRDGRLAGNAKLRQAGIPQAISRSVQFESCKHQKVQVCRSQGSYTQMSSSGWAQVESSDRRGPTTRGMR